MSTVRTMQGASASVSLGGVGGWVGGWYGVRIRALSHILAIFTIVRGAKVRIIAAHGGREPLAYVSMCAHTRLYERARRGRSE